MNTNSKLRLQQTLQDLSHLDLTDHIATDVAVEIGGGAYSDVFQSELSAGWQPRSDNIVRLLELENGNLISVLKSGETVENQSVETPVLFHRTKVAVKKLRIWGKTDHRIEKEVRKELQIWAGLSNPNILPLLGYLHNWRRSSYPSFVSPWMENGTLREYYRNHEDFDHTAMTVGIASGLSYLHSQNIVHADLKCDNVLLSAMLEPLLTDFGLSRQLIASLSSTTTLGGTVQWSAPELLNGSLKRPNVQTDVWALGMTILELTTKNLPYVQYQNIDNRYIAQTIMQGTLPSPPDNLDQWPAPKQDLWSIYEDCCQMDPLERSSIPKILNMLVNQNHVGRHTMNDRSASLLQQTLEMYRYLDLSHDIVEKDFAIAKPGSYGYVYHAKLSKSWRPRSDPNIMRLLKLEKENGERMSTVAVKRIYVYSRPDYTMEKEVCNELKIWASLSHPNILPLLGYVLNWDQAQYPSFVSPWMKNGSLLDYYLRVERYDSTLMTAGITSGLLYLHSRKIVHSDLKSDNVLISASNEPLLMDFGLSHKYLSSNTSSGSGTLRWSAPEIINQTVQCASAETDIWALGMTILELLTRDFPYAEHPNSDRVVRMAISRGELPSPPHNLDRWLLPEQRLWSIYQSCCQIDSTKRPNVEQVHERLLSLHSLSE